MMAPIRRWAGQVLAALRWLLVCFLLMLFVAVVALWARSYRRGDVVQVQVGEGTRWHGFTVTSARGKIRLSMDYLVTGWATGTERGSSFWPVEFSRWTLSREALG